MPAADDLDTRVMQAFSEIDNKSTQEAIEAYRFNPSLKATEVTDLRICKTCEKVKDIVSTEKDIHFAGQMLYHFARVYSRGDEAQVKDICDAYQQNPAFQDQKSKVITKCVAEEALNNCKEVSIYRKLVQRDLEITNDVTKQTTKNIKQLVDEMTEAAWTFQDSGLIEAIEKMNTVWKVYLEEKDTYDTLLPEQKKHYELKKMDNQLKGINCALRRDPVYLRQALAMLEDAKSRVKNVYLYESIQGMERRWKLYYKDAVVITKEFSPDNTKVN